MLSPVTFMWAQIPSGPDNFKRVFKCQTLRTSFYGGFESVANIGTNFWWRPIQSYQTVAIIKGN